MRIRGYLPEVLFLAVAVVIVVYVLFIPPMVGLANSGDFARITNWFGLNPVLADPHDALYLFVIPHWEWHRQLQVHYPSSEVLLVGASLLPMLVMPQDRPYDIRLLGAVHAICFLLVLLLLTKYARALPVVRRLLLYGLVLLIFADVAYLAYFNSFFSEPAGFLFTGAVVAFALALTVDREPGRRRTLLTVGYFASCILLTTAKLQYFASAFPLAVLGYRLTAPTSAAKSQGKASRRFVIGLTLLLPLTSIACFGAYNLISDRVTTNNVYNEIFYELLVYSPDPVSDAVELGLDPRFVELEGTNALNYGVPREALEAAARIGTAGVLRFYAHHPDRFIGLLRRASASSFWQRPTYLGNYERSYVLPDGSEPIEPNTYLPYRYFSHKCAFWSAFKERAVPGQLWFQCGFLVLSALVFAIAWVRSRRSFSGRMTAEILCTLLIMAVAEFLIVVVGDGTMDIIKHLFLYNLLCEISLVFVLMYAAGAIASLCRRRRPQIAAR